MIATARVMRARPLGLAWLARVAARVAMVLAAVVTVPTLTAQGAQAPGERLQLVLRDHAARGLPVAPLMAKLAEGRAKGASEARVVAAVELLAARLDSAARALAPAPTEGELREGAEALAASASPAMLVRLRSRAGRQPLEPSLALLTRLLRRGAQPALAEQAVWRLLDRRLPTATLLATADAIVRDLDSGGQLGDILDTRVGPARSFGDGTFTADGVGNTGTTGLSGTGGSPRNAPPPPPPPRRP
ncbi:MAG: hypothetical protein MUF21_09455 [Gemmatimonadaceae bacterium]|jgi:hypothetical protein|nr:hypothetical protein [Gemmatimonadaceae bacterium]